MKPKCMGDGKKVHQIAPKFGLLRMPPKPEILKIRVLESDESILPKEELVLGLVQSSATLWKDEHKAPR